MRFFPWQSSGYRLTVLADNPVAYWRLNELSGITSDDLIGSNDGTYTPNSAGSWTGGTLAQSGAIAGDNSALFNGTTGYTTVPSLSAFSFIQNTAIFSLEFWVKNNDITARKAIIGNNATSGEKGFVVIFENGAGFGTKAIRCSIFKGTIGNPVTAFRSPDNVITDTNWHHVVIVHTAAASNSAKIYVDGVSQSITYESAYTSLSSGNSTRALFTGAVNNAGSPSLPYNGNVDEVAIYNTALSQARVTAHYEARFNP